ncbi:MAG TPA: hypothetical protein VJ885_12710, partial [Thermoanaerobaculia bacterium]|nr:hypothetical protein [Thermoanaerobaculia bacterium]
MAVVPRQADPQGPVVVTLPTALLRLFPGAERRVELSVRSVGEAIAALDARWPGMRDRLCDSTPALRRHLNIFVDGERAVGDAADARCRDDRHDGGKRGLSGEPGCPGQHPPHLRA